MNIESEHYLVDPFRINVPIFFNSYLAAYGLLATTAEDLASLISITSTRGSPKSLERRKNR